jgi:hypothetical protein
MLKLCQSSAAFWLVWLIVVLADVVVMLALPAKTVPPCGDAKLADAAPNATTDAAAFRMKPDWTTAHFPPDNSETVTMAPVRSFRIER